MKKRFAVNAWALLLTIVLLLAACGPATSPEDATVEANGGTPVTTEEEIGEESTGEEATGPRFPDMTQAYDPALRDVARRAAAAAGLTLREGVYAYVAGPSFETPAELRFLQIAGGDAVGMSTAPEVVVAHHAGVRVLGISTIANLALPDPPPGLTVNHEEVLATGQLAVPRLILLVRGILQQLSATS